MKNAAVTLATKKAGNVQAGTAIMKVATATVTMIGVAEDFATRMAYVQAEGWDKDIL